MKVEIRFSVQGYIKQVVEITKDGYTPERIQEELNKGILVTTVQEDGTMDVTASGEVVGKVASVDNNLEYDDFEVEESDEE